MASAQTGKLSTRHEVSETSSVSSDSLNWTDVESLSDVSTEDDSDTRKASNRSPATKTDCCVLAGPSKLVIAINDSRHSDSGHEVWDVKDTVARLRASCYRNNGVILLTLTSFPFRIIHITDVKLRSQCVGQPLSSCFASSTANTGRSLFCLTPDLVIQGCHQGFDKMSQDCPKVAEVLRPNKDGTLRLAYYAVVLTPGWLDRFLSG